MHNLKSIFSGKTVLVTGHTGFKGSWLSTWLVMLGANVIGLSDDLVTKPSNYEVSKIHELLHDYRVDIRDSKKVSEIVLKSQPDFVFHLAAQALVGTSYKFPLDTLTVNAVGTANVLDSLKHLNKQVVSIMITSDKAYDNVEWIWGYRETDPLGGKDPYSASKSMAEMAIRCYVESFYKDDAFSNIRIAVARAGNVIGGGDWAVDRIVPDCMRAWSTNEVVDIRSPNATRPWQHVLEPLSGYLSLAAKLSENNKFHGEAYNFGPPANQNESVSKLLDQMSTCWSNVRWNDISKGLQSFHEAGLLKLNCDKSLLHLDWQSVMCFDETVLMTVEWYKEFYQNKPASMMEFTKSQIMEYIQLAEQRGIVWG